MFLKRLAAIVLTLLLTLQLAACEKEPSNTLTDDTIQTTSVDSSDLESSSSDQKFDNSYQDDTQSKTNSLVLSSDDTHSSSDLQQPVSSDKTNSEITSTFNEQQVVTSNPENDKNDITINCNHGDADPYKNVSKAEFYADYKTACCNLDATYRSKHGLLSGSLSVPGQYATESKNRPMSSGKYIRNTATVYLDNGNTYVVLDASGNEAMRIHKAGGYITLEEVAAYMYAFGGGEQIPANYTSSKKTKPSNSIWGEYLRVNHSYFIGNTDKYPYEPELPNISGCGGSLRYYEMDIGTTGTSTPGYAPQPYIQGNKVNRGAARIVYTRQDLNGNGTFENNEVYVFYTHNHYNDFREYLNYYGGWGQMFGNVTGGGEYSSKTNANPTPYVKTAYKNFS